MAGHHRTCVHPDASPYRTGLGRNDANHAPLTPLSFLERTADVYPDRVACVHGAQAYTYRQLRERCRRLASALERRGIRPGDTVAAMLPNTPPMLEAHYGVPMCGAVLNALNTRLDAAALAFILGHGEAKALITDAEFAPVMRAALASAGRDLLVVDVDDPERQVRASAWASWSTRTSWPAAIPASRPCTPPTSGRRSRSTTPRAPRQPEGRRLPPPRRAPERGRQRARLEHAAAPGLPVDAADVPLQRLVLPWTVALQAGTQVCLSKVAAETIFAAIAERGVTHLCGAPIVMGMLVNASARRAARSTRRSG
jgi:fatty-acyl-CoA synthase